MFSPSQLALLVRMADEALGAPGVFMEIGCARGSTTIHLNKHLDFRGDIRRYVCIDTFSGFIEPDIEHEVTARGKDEAYLKRSFPQNRKSWFDHTMRINDLARVETIEAPVQEVDLDRVAGGQGGRSPWWTSISTCAGEGRARAGVAADEPGRRDRGGRLRRAPRDLRRGFPRLSRVRVRTRHRDGD
jgi:hypothetical protein